MAEVIESMDDLVRFVKDISPCLTKVSGERDRLGNVWVWVSTGGERVTITHYACTWYAGRRTDPAPHAHLP